MHNPFNAYLRDIVKIEYAICNDREAEQEGGGSEEENCIDVGFLCGSGSRDAKWCPDQILLIGH
jgi:hypothetical protein